MTVQAIGSAVDITDDSAHATVTELAGWSVHETGGANAVIILLKETDDSGQIIATIDLAASASETIFLPRSYLTSGGVYANVAGTGTLEGVLHRG